MKLRSVCRECGLWKSELLRHLNRCLALHADGRIYGWRALLPHQHVKPYVRLVVPDLLSRGLAGAFRQFLRDHPAIQEPLDRGILTRKTGDAVPESRRSHVANYNHFRRLCLGAQISETQYPLNAKDKGQRALRRYARELLQRHFLEAAGQLGGSNARTRARLGTGHEPHLQASVPFDLVSIDAHRLNLIGCIGIPTHQGVELVPIQRLQFLPVIEHESTAVLGYQVAIAQEASASDVIEAMRNAISVWRPRQLTLPGHRYPEGAALPSGVIPAAAGQCWSALLIDNASIHYSTAVCTRLRQRLGCALNFGPVRQWYRRPLIEALFSSLERAGFLRLPNSTGTSATDPRKPDAAANAVKYVMLWEEMLDLIDVVVCTYNGVRRDSLGGYSPLERIDHALLNARTRWLPRTLPALPPSVPDLDVVVETPTIRGDVATGRRPYVRIVGVKYTNEVLASASALIGTPLRVHIRWSDLRTVKAFLPSGAELGTLVASSAWSRTRHDRTLRRHVLRAIRDKTLVVPAGEDPIQCFLVLKAQQSLQRRTRRRQRPRISVSATTLARAVHVTGQPVPTVNPGHMPPRVPSPRALRDILLPSFVPNIRHRGLLK